MLLQQAEAAAREAAAREVTAKAAAKAAKAAAKLAQAQCPDWDDAPGRKKRPRGVRGPDAETAAVLAASAASAAAQASMAAAEAAAAAREGTLLDGASQPKPKARAKSRTGEPHSGWLMAEAAATAAEAERGSGEAGSSAEGFALMPRVISLKLYALCEREPRIGPALATPAVPNPNPTLTCDAQADLRAGPTRMAK